MNRRVDILAQSRPRILSYIDYKTELGQKWWKDKREIAEKRTGNNCIACGVNKRRAKWKKWLEGHELMRIDFNSCTAYVEDIIPLCYLCHRFCHPRQTMSMMSSGILTEHAVITIFNHGLYVLSESGVKPPHFVAFSFLSLKGYSPYDSYTIVKDKLGLPEKKESGCWSSWSIVIENKEFYSDYNSIVPISYYDN